jgi:hypothetical protein
MKTILILATLFYASAVNASTDTLEKMPHDLEVRFALSALPKPLREKASVYVLDPATGYVLDRQGTNAQTCLAARTDWVREDYSGDYFVAICYDPVGMKNQGKVWFDVAEFRAKGTSPSEVKKIIEKRFADGPTRLRSGLAFLTWLRHSIGVTRISILVIKKSSLELCHT